MFIIADARMPRAARQKLETFGELLPFSTKGLTYSSLAGHPDIFFSQTPSGLVFSPNVPKRFLNLLQLARVPLKRGERPVGSQYPESAGYNAFINDTYLIHQLSYTDPAVLRHCLNLTPIAVNQGYTRCNLIEAGGLYITSDRGIQKKLEQLGEASFFVDPGQVRLPGQAYGFFGGCAGYTEGKLYMTGSCRHFKEGPGLKQMLAEREVELIELYEGPLWDGGGIYFIKRPASSTTRVE
jgi:hypothetical protein